MTNNKGFTLIETIVAASLLLMVVATLIPAANLLMNERMVLEQKHHIVKELHRELQSYLWDNKHPLLPNDYMKKINGAEATFSFTTEEELMKGCVTWTNARKEKVNFVYMATRTNKNGFTFIESLLTISILLMTLPFIGYLVKGTDFTSNYDQLAGQQFFLLFA